MRGHGSSGRQLYDSVQRKSVPGAGVMGIVLAALAVQCAQWSRRLLRSAHNQVVKPQLNRKGSRQNHLLPTAHCPSLTAYCLLITAFSYRYSRRCSRSQTLRGNTGDRVHGRPTSSCSPWSLPDRRSSCGNPNLDYHFDCLGQP